MLLFHYAWYAVVHTPENLFFGCWLLYGLKLWMTTRKLPEKTYMPSYISKIKDVINGIKLYLYPYNARLNPNDTVLLVLDMIEDYKPLFNKSLIKNIVDNIRLAKQFNVPVVYTKWERTERDMVGDVVDSKMFWSYYIPKKSCIIRELSYGMRSSDHIIKTKFPNAFAESLNNVSLKEIMGSRKNLIICGTWTESCTSHTADAASEINIRPYILKNASCGHWPISEFYMIVLGMTNSEIIKSVSFM